MVFGYRIKNIQAAAYNGERTVHDLNFISVDISNFGTIYYDQHP